MRTDRGTAATILRMCVATLGVVSCAIAPPPPAAQQPAQSLPLIDRFDGPDVVLARPNDDPLGSTSPWLVTSGTLFRDAQQGWTGVPDDGSAPGSTGSAVFRMVSRGWVQGDVTVRLRLLLEGWTSTARTPRRAFDGTHVWVRHRSPASLYAVSVDRRDGAMVVKKKCPGGTDEDGTYVDLGKAVAARVEPGRWQDVTVTVRDRADGSVEIVGVRDGVVVRGLDRGAGCPALRGDGAIGLRGDNAELRVDDIDVRPVG